MNNTDSKLSLKYAQLREHLIEQGLFESLDINDDEFSEDLSQLQEMLTQKGCTQQSIDTAIEAIWLAVKLGICNLDNAPQIRAAFETLEI